jgi:hypothetical protein
MRRGLIVTVLALAPAAAAQLSDLQPGRNFVQVLAFGVDMSDEIGAGDVDADGDLDVVVANGVYMTQPNRIFINMGGLQGGHEGDFNEQTATRFAGFPDDSSRDVEFVDLDADGDLDLFIANNAGTGPPYGEPSRFYLNAGGLQGGTIGWFTEGTDSCWGQLVSVPVVDQVFGGNQGPFRGYSCDCDFGDLDDDGDQDLFWSTYGPSLDGYRPSLVFLNDGGGVFDELYPWADPAADIQMHATDVDLVDFDGDFDIDVAVSSRNSQARVFANNLAQALGTTPFTDITQQALVATGAGYASDYNYEVEYGDADGDGDFDLWMASYGWNTGSGKDSLLRNDGSASGIPFRFSKQPAWIPQTESDGNASHQTFTDHDGDGDLDVFTASWGGLSRLFTSSLAQGLDPGSVGLYHRNGAAGSLTPWNELPTNLTNIQGRDSTAADLDGDGDEDLLAANEAGNAENRLFRNVLGVPDVHAPSILALTQQPDKPAGNPTVIHAAVRDNSTWYVVATYDVLLVWSAGGGPETLLPMTCQGSQQFRGVIPDLGDATVSYHVEVIDRAGNTGVSPTFTYVQGAGSGPWTDLEGGLAGAGGTPKLHGNGTLLAGSAGSLALAQAAPDAPTLLFVSLASTPVPFKGGTLAAWPAVALLPLSTDAGGGWTLSWAAWPAGVPAGTLLVFQAAVADAGAVQDVALSNALQALAP